MIIITSTYSVILVGTGDQSCHCEEERRGNQRTTSDDSSNWSTPVLPSVVGEPCLVGVFGYLESRVWLVVIATSPQCRQLAMTADELLSQLHQRVVLAAPADYEETTFYEVVHADRTACV